MACEPARGPRRQLSHPRRAAVCCKTKEKGVNRVARRQCVWETVTAPLVAGSGPRMSTAGHHGDPVTHSHPNRPFIVGDKHDDKDSDNVGGK